MLFRGGINDRMLLLARLAASDFCSTVWICFVNFYNVLIVEQKRVSGRCSRSLEPLFPTTYPPRLMPDAVL